ncbi:hypothetical protein PPROV_001009100 [Pycnococcus provasolii]|uniref:Sugar phosphate transporter domain-containing protein n=2 Tax=Pycnococcus provasolii TaxID=41880 RepID=A0A830HXA0_9CHLO|nr:hypothetical protein PPROV_001009100 [Pycnococcus provasolii]
MSSGGGGAGAGGVRQYGLILAWVLAWWFASNTLTLLNRHILVVLRFHHPIIVASLGMFGTFVFSSLKRRYAAASSSAGGDGDPNYRKSPSLSREFIIKNVLPISFAAGLCLSIAQIPYFYMSVSLIQMLKSIVPLFSMVLGVLVGVEKLILTKGLAILVICLGALVAGMGEVSFSYVGFFILVSDMICFTTSQALTQRLLQQSSVPISSVDLLYYVTPGTLSVMAVGILIIDGPKLGSVVSTMLSDPFPFLAATALGAACNVTATEVVRLTSALIRSVLAQLKTILLVIASVFINGDIVTGTHCFGYSICIAGMLWYAHPTAHKPRGSSLPK